MRVCVHKGGNEHTFSTYDSWTALKNWPCSLLFSGCKNLKGLLQVSLDPPLNGAFIIPHLTHTDGLIICIVCCWFDSVIVFFLVSLSSPLQKLVCLHSEQERKLFCAGWHRELCWSSVQLCLEPDAVPTHPNVSNTRRQAGDGVGVGRVWSFLCLQQWAIPICRQKNAVLHRTVSQAVGFFVFKSSAHTYLMRTCTTVWPLISDRQHKMSKFLLLLLQTLGSWNQLEPCWFCCMYLLYVIRATKGYC